MKRLGLIGYPLSHSFSRQYFQEKFKTEGITNWSYELFPLKEISDLSNLIQSETGLVGLNVTIPHKESVIPFLDELSDDAAAIGAVNTIVLKEGKRIGHNTDWIGFKNSIVPLLQDHHTHALILGSGGASKAVLFALQQLNIPSTVVSRSPDHLTIGYNDLDEKKFRQHQIIINASPVGTFPEVDMHPAIPFEFITNRHLLYDLVYNPPVSTFLKRGSDKGATIINGYQMLVGQAEAAWKIWYD